MKKTLTVLLLIALSMSMVFAAGDKEAASSASAASEKRTTLTIGEGNSFASLTPFQAHASNGILTWALYEYLGAYNSENVFQGTIAKEWTTADNKVYDITIYDYIYDAKGNHITAADVEWSYSQAKPTIATPLFDTVVATGEYTVQMTLVSASMDAFEESMNVAPIVSKAEYEKSADYMAADPVSTSPWVVTDYVPGSSVTLTRNANYWQKDASQLGPVAASKYETLKFMTISEAASQTMALETGAVDAIAKISESQQKKFLPEGEYGSLFTANAFTNGSITDIYFSGLSSLGDDVNLRKAIAHAIDRKALTKGYTDGNGIMCELYGSQYAIDAPTIYTAENPYLKYDPELAKEYLAKSNYDGRTLKYLTVTSGGAKDGQIISKYLADVGIKIEVDAFDLAVYQQSIGKLDQYEIIFCNNSVQFNSKFWEKQYSLSKKTGMTKYGWVDEALSDQVKLTNTVEGHTIENINKSCELLDAGMYGFGICVNASCAVIKNGIVSDYSKIPHSRNGYPLYWAEKD